MPCNPAAFIGLTQRNLMGKENISSYLVRRQYNSESSLVCNIDICNCGADNFYKLEEWREPFPPPIPISSFPAVPAPARTPPMAHSSHLSVFHHTFSNCSFQSLGYIYVLLAHVFICLPGFSAATLCFSDTHPVIMLKPLRVLLFLIQRTSLKGFAV